MTDREYVVKKVSFILFYVFLSVMIVSIAYNIYGYDNLKYFTYAANAFIGSGILLMSAVLIVASFIYAFVKDAGYRKVNDEGIIGILEIKENRPFTLGWFKNIILTISIWIYLYTYSINVLIVFLILRVGFSVFTSFHRNRLGIDIKYK